MFYNFIKHIAIIWIALFYRVRVEGRENFPAVGPVVVCANHTYAKDLIFIGRFASRKIYWIAKSELFRIPIFGRFIKSLGAFPINRGERDRESVKTVYRVLKAGLPLGIFPEGHRYMDLDKRPRFSRGFVTIALNSSADILPVAIRYEGGPFGRGKLFSRTVLYFGQLVKLDRGRGYSRAELDEVAETVTSWVHKKIVC